MAARDARMGRLGPAKRAAEELSSVPSVAHGALRLLAECAMLEGRDAEAEEIYRGALEQRPDDVRIKYGLASALVKQDKLMAAAQIIEELLRLKASAHQALLLLGELHVRAGDFRRAAATFKQAATMAGPARVRREAEQRFREIQRQMGTR